MKQKVLSALIIVFLVGVIIAQCIGIKNIEANRNQPQDEATQQVDVTVTPQTTQPQVTQPQVTQPTVQEPTFGQEDTTPVSPDQKNSNKPESTKEIIDQYTLLVDKFKQQKPAYKKKEYQALPEEYHNFSDTINKALGLAAG